MGWNGTQERPADSGRKIYLLCMAGASDLQCCKECVFLLQEKLEHCLESKGSMGEDDLDGESIFYLRQLQRRHSIFKSSAVSSAFKIASFSYNEKDRGQPVLVSFFLSPYHRP